MHVCVYMSISPWLCNPDVYLRVYMSVSPFVLQLGCASSSLQCLCPLGFPGYVFLSICIWLYVPLASQPGPVFICVSVCLCRLGFAPRVCTCVFICLWLYVYESIDSILYVPLASKPVCVCVYLCVFMFLPSWLRNVGVYLCVLYFYGHLASQLWCASVRYMSMSPWFRNVCVSVCLYVCPLGFATWLCICVSIIIFLCPLGFATWVCIRLRVYDYVFSPWLRMLGVYRFVSVFPYL